MIVDTSAIVAVLRREEGADRLTEQLLSRDDIRISAGTLIEARIVAERDGGAAEFDELLEAIGVEVVPVDIRQAEIAFEGFRRFGKGRHRAGLNFGDLFAYALARALYEPLLFKGADFVHTDVRPGRHALNPAPAHPAFAADLPSPTFAKGAEAHVSPPLTPPRFRYIFLHKDFMKDGKRCAMMSKTRFFRRFRGGSMG